MTGKGGNWRTRSVAVDTKAAGGNEIYKSELQARIRMPAAGAGAESVLFHTGVDMAALEAVEGRLAAGGIVELPIPPIIVPPQRQQKREAGDDRQQQDSTDVGRKHGERDGGLRSGKRKTRPAGARRVLEY